MKKEFQDLSPKVTFIAGIGGALLVIFAIGFFVMLAMMMSGNTNQRFAQVDDTTVSAGKAVNPRPSPPIPGSTKIALEKITKNDHIRGNVNAPITIVEFSDPECPFCRRFHGTMQQVMDNYKDKVRWVYKHAPLDSLHRKSRKEAQAMECAYDQGGNKAFWKFADRLYEITPSNDGLAVSQLPEIAKFAGLNIKKFNTCLDSDKFANKIQKHLDEAQKAGLRGTPYSVIITNDGKTIPVSGAFSFEQMKAMIDPLLK